MDWCAHRDSVLLHAQPKRQARGDKFCPQPLGVFCRYGSVAWCYQRVIRQISHAQARTYVCAVVVQSVSMYFDGRNSIGHELVIEKTARETFCVALDYSSYLHIPCSRRFLLFYCACAGRGTHSSGLHDTSWQCHCHILVWRVVITRKEP